jgi:hypothetical protein
MKKFFRQKSGSTPTADIDVDFGAAAATVAHVFEPGDYSLRIDSARVIQSKNGTLLIVLDLVVAEDGGRVATRPLWVQGPNADGNQLAENNMALVAQLLSLAGLPTSGNMGSLIPNLRVPEFEARLVLDPDRVSGRTYNALAEIYAGDAP